MFVLSGLVPSPELAGLLLRAAEVAYSPYVRSELVVDESLESAGWLANSPEAIVLLPTITDGSILMSEGRVQVSGRAPTSTSVTQLTEALGSVTELPVVASDVRITNLDMPIYVIAALAGRVELSGVVPSEEIRGLLVDGAAGSYGRENVVDSLTVDAGVYSSLWMYNGGPLLQAMSVFPEYELRIDGTAFSGFIRGGVTFEPGSAVFTADYARVLDVGVSVLTRDQSLDLAIEGHTDSDGSTAANLVLSQQRADAVLAYFVENGIDPARLIAVGLGESAPVVANDTVEGRARNRRIEFKLNPRTG
jgi:outer membrane protein OmpA-like peptidoglycan-associated protein